MTTPDEVQHEKETLIRLIKWADKLGGYGTRMLAFAARYLKLSNGEDFHPVKDFTKLFSDLGITSFTNIHATLSGDVKSAEAFLEKSGERGKTAYKLTEHGNYTVGQFLKLAEGPPPTVMQETRAEQLFKLKFRTCPPADQLLAQSAVMMGYSDFPSITILLAIYSNSNHLNALTHCYLSGQFENLDIEELVNDLISVGLVFEGPDSRDVKCLELTEAGLKAVEEILAEISESIETEWAKFVKKSGAQELIPGFVQCQ